MLIIGLAGGVGSGKSFVAQCFQELGAAILDADRVGHDVLELVDVQEKLIGFWKQRIITDGAIDRKKLGQIVFGPDADPAELEKLEQVTHPIIREKIEAQLNQLRSAQHSPAVVLDAPVMFRAGWHELCDKVVFIETSLKQRQQRTANRGWQAAEVQRREARQMPLDQKRELATDIIDNTGTQTQTLAQIKQLWICWQPEMPSQN